MPTPTAPSALLGPAGAAGCSSATLSLPPLQDPSCTSYTVEVALAEDLPKKVALAETSTSVKSKDLPKKDLPKKDLPWRVAIEGALPPVVTVSSLEPMTAYIFRLRLVSNHAKSNPSDPSAVSLAGGIHLRLLEAPEVSALSSISFAISWADHALTSICYPDVTYAVQLRRAHTSRTFAVKTAGGAVKTSGEEAEWVTVKASVSRPAVELSEGSCPEGCAFRYRPNGISGWSLWSAPSLPTATLAVAAGMRGSERLRCRVNVALYPAAGAQATAELYAMELAAALKIDAALLTVRDTRDTDLFILEFLPSSEADLAVAPPSAQLHRVRQLVLHASAASSRALRATLELTKLRPPHDSAETLLSEAEVRRAREALMMPTGLIMVVICLIVFAGGGVYHVLTMQTGRVA